MVIVLLGVAQRLNVILVKFNLKLLFSAWYEVAYVNYVNERKTTAGYENFIIVEDQEYFVTDFLQV